MPTPAVIINRLPCRRICTGLPRCRSEFHQKRLQRRITLRTRRLPKQTLQPTLEITADRFIPNRINPGTRLDNPFKRQIIGTLPGT